MRTKSVFIASLLSAGLVLGSVSVAHADTPSPSASPVATSSPVATTHAEQVAAYKVALAAYQVAMDLYNVALKAATSQFKADQQLRKDKIKAISVAFQTAIAKANSDRQAAIAAATSPDQKSVARTIFTAAISSAAIARQSALDALGPELVRPAIPTKPAEPTKPEPPVKSTTASKATATAKAETPKPKSTKSEKNS